MEIPFPKGAIPLTNGHPVLHLTTWEVHLQIESKRHWFQTKPHFSSFHHLLASACCNASKKRRIRLYSFPNEGVWYVMSSDTPFLPSTYWTTHSSSFWSWPCLDVLFELPPEFVSHVPLACLPCFRLEASMVQSKGSCSSLVHNSENTQVN